MDGERAYVLVDIAIGERLDDLAPPHLLIAKLLYPEPRENGLPSSSDCRRLDAFEDALKTGLSDTPDLCVGRVTTAGVRDFYVYTAEASESVWLERLRPLAHANGLRLELNIRDDPQCDGYWQGLYPGPEDWVVIRNLRLVERIRETDAELTKRRELDHLCFFPSRTQAERFAAALPDGGFTIGSIEGARDGRWRVHCTQACTFENDPLTKQTLWLFRKAAEYAGEYDGWGTFVADGADAATSGSNRR
jgi:hypothetical protein